jgi:hypothetical protein
MKRLFAAMFILFIPVAALADDHVKDDGSRDLSKIDGQLVPVGDHTAYHYDFFPKVDISVDPIGWLFGSYGVSIGYALGRNVAIRADLDYFAPLNSSDTGVQVGVGLPIYLRRTWLGIFLEPGFVARTVNNSSDNLIGPQVLIGYHWTFDSGLNISLAAGAGRNMASQYSGDEIFPAGYIRFGYAF